MRSRRTWLALSALALAAVHLCWPEDEAPRAATPERAAEAAPAPTRSATLHHSPHVSVTQAVRTTQKRAAPVSFDQTQLDQASERTLHEAQQRAIQRCMRARGQEYVPMPFHNGDERDEPPARTDVEGARALGYGIALAAEQGTPPPDMPSDDPNQARYQAMSPAQREQFDHALLGDLPALESELAEEDLAPNIGVAYLHGEPTMYWDRNACVAQAEREVFGDDVYTRSLRMRLSEVDESIWNAVQESEAVRAGFARWQDCMRRAGHEYESPDAASQSLADRLAAGTLSMDQLRQEEVAVASADARCQQSTDLTALQSSVRRQLELPLALEHQDVLQQIVQHNESALERASSALASSDEETRTL